MAVAGGAQQQRRQRRRRRRLIAITGFVFLAIGLAWFFESQATTTVLVTRYADIASPANANRETALSVRGQQRARELARVLADVDVVAGIDAIFVNSNRRTRDTGAPLAELNSAPVITVQDPVDVEALVLRILREYKGKIVLIVTEPELIQPVIAEMQGSKKLPQIDVGEYDNLYIVSIPWFGKVKTLHLRYGGRYVPTPASSDL